MQLLVQKEKSVASVRREEEEERQRLARQTERLDNTRRALLHILQDSHQSNLRLERSRKAMIHIMSDLKETTEEVQRRELELREKQEQLIQAAKLATLGELATGIAHELNNPLNNIGLFIGNALDLIELGMVDAEPERTLQELHSAMQQVRKATDIISHLRTFGRVAPVSLEPVHLLQVVSGSISLMKEQLRWSQIDVVLDFPEDVVVSGNAIRLEQVFLNLLTNARDALTTAEIKRITITCRVEKNVVEIRFSDTGPGIPEQLEQRIFDPFFTTKEVGAGTGLGLSIINRIIKDHQGSISVENHPGEGAHFLIQLPVIAEEE
jgi:C4-dicarboxylate-specific signal transduction histidine kinase